MTTTKSPSYFRLEKEIKKISHLDNILSLAIWDRATNLPAGSTPSRQKEIATVSSIIHQMSSSKDIGKLIIDAIDETEELNQWQLANLHKIKKSYDHSTCIDQNLEHENTITTSECEYVWRSARLENDWKKLEPYQDKVFNLAQKIAKIKSDKFAMSEYDVLIDSFDPDRKSSDIELVYNNLKDTLPDLIQKIIKKQSSEKVIALTQNIDEATQKEIGTRVMRAMGFDMNFGRLDKSIHPFCAGTREDVRITTRYDESYFLSSLLAIIHESGHGLYQQNLPANYSNQPVGSAKGMAFHESQSLIMEMQSARSPEFALFLAKILKDEFNFKGKEYSADNLYRLMTRVQPSFIRTEADEVTYPLHVIIRFEIEKAIISGNLRATDLPEYWNKKMNDYLGIIPTNYKDGCMQDIHWPSGWFGYFPCYTNGAIIASMLMKAARAKNSGINQELANGNFSSINNYLNTNLRNYGSVKSSSDLLEISTGHKEIKSEIFTDYLEQKYL